MTQTDATSYISANKQFADLVRSKDPGALQLMVLFEQGLDILCYNQCALNSTLDDGDPKSFLGEVQALMTKLLQSPESGNPSNDSIKGVIVSIIRDMAVRRLAENMEKRVSEFATTQKLYAEVVEKVSNDPKKEEGKTA